jgi:hypothetical protein
MGVFPQFTKAGRQHSDVFFHLPKPEDNTSMFFFHLPHPADMASVFVPST